MRLEPDEETDALAHAVIGAAIEVHRFLGPGFLENAYEAALAVELGLRGIPFERQRIVELVYKTVPIATHRLDLVVGQRLLIELKAVDGIAPVHFAQMISYLNATRLRLGLLINFAVPVLRHGIHRVVRS